MLALTPQQGMPRIFFNFPPLWLTHITQALPAIPPTYLTYLLPSLPPHHHRLPPFPSHQLLSDPFIGIEGLWTLSSRSLTQRLRPEPAKPLEHGYNYNSIMPRHRGGGRPSRNIPACLPMGTSLGRRASGRERRGKRRR